MSMRDVRMKSTQMMTSGDRPQQFADEQGQAAVEFVFFFLAVVMLLMFIMTMFFFSQDFFQEITRARGALVGRFRNPVPYEVPADRVYQEVIRVRLRSFPFMGRFTLGTPPVMKRVRLVGGARPPYTVPGAVECAAAAVLVRAKTGTSNNTVPGGIWTGTGAALGACGVYAIW